jgi:hypothetical protein
VGFCGNNSGVIAATLVAGALGMTGSLFGCLATSGVAAAAKVAKKKGWIASSVATERLKRVVARDVQPYANLMLKTYFGSTLPAVSVFSLRKHLARTKSRERQKAA